MQSCNKRKAKRQRAKENGINSERAIACFARSRCLSSPPLLSHAAFQLLHRRSHALQHAPLFPLSPHTAHSKPAFSLDCCGSSSVSPSALRLFFIHSSMRKINTETSCSCCRQMRSRKSTDMSAEKSAPGLIVGSFTPTHSPLPTTTSAAEHNMNRNKNKKKVCCLERASARGGSTRKKGHTLAGPPAVGVAASGGDSVLQQHGQPHRMQQIAHRRWPTS